MATIGPTTTATEDPLPAVEDEGPQGRLPPGQWVKENLFNTWYNAAFTVVFGLLLAWALFAAARFVFVTGRWEIVEVNLTNFMVGRYPREELFRIWVALYVIAATVGLGLGLAGRRAERAPWHVTLRRVGPLLLALVVILSFTRTYTPALLVAGALAVLLAARFVGARLPDRAGRYLPLVYLATVIVSLGITVGFGGVPLEVWGGLLLTVFAAVAGIVLSFPFGVALALGRRSSFPAIRVVCVGYIESIRGVPLVTLLFFGAVVLGFFFPPGVQRPPLVVRALIAITMFAAAYIAEIVRGGLQSVPKGQSEAAKSIGLSPLKTTRMIVLPQALRNVIPAIVGQFISLYKDTSLLAILGLLELLAVAQTVVLQPDFLGQSLQAETLVFAAFLYWTACYSMSRASQRLERRLGVGER